MYLYHKWNTRKMCVFQICHQSRDSSSFVLTSAKLLLLLHHSSSFTSSSSSGFSRCCFIFHSHLQQLSFFSPKFLIENQSANYAASFYEWPQPKRQKKTVTKYRILFSLLTNKNRDTINKLLCVIKSVFVEFLFTKNGKSHQKCWTNIFWY